LTIYQQQNIISARRDAVEELFRKLGINDNEREVYLSVLRAGKIAVNQVARETSINRTTVYSIAKKLESMGIVAIDYGQKISYLVAVPTSQLVGIFEREEKKLAEKKQIAIKLADELSSLASERHYSVPRIKFVEENDLEEYLYVAYPRWEESAKGKENVWRGFQDDSFTTYYEKWINWIWKRSRRDFDVEFFINESNIEKQLTRKYGGRKMKILPNHISFDSSFWTTGEYLIMAQTRVRPHYLVEIHDEVLARNQRELFKGLWSLAPDLPMD
jgi:predicted transcriptional regulator